MTFSNCETKFSCTGIAIVASLIVGIIAAFLQITAVIDIPAILLGAVLLIAITYLLAILFAVSLSQTPASSCALCSVLSVLLFGILATILFATILLIIDFVATSVIGAIVVGALVFSFSLMITTTACLIRRISRCND